MTDTLTLPHAQELGWQLMETKRTRQQHAWSRLQRNLARTLDDLYMICEADWHADLVDSAVQYLEQSVHDFKQAAQGLQHMSTCTAALPCRLQIVQQKQVHLQQQQQLQHTPASDSLPLSVQQDVASMQPSRLSQESSRAAQLEAGMQQADALLCDTALSGTAAEHYLVQQQADVCSSDISLADDDFSSCSSSSNSSCFSSCNGSKSSIASSSSCGAVWHSQMNLSKVFDEPPAVNGLHHKLSSPDRLRKSPSQTKAAADERHARAERLRTALAEEKLARLVQEKLAKQQRRKQDHAGAAAARSADKHQRSEVLRAAHISKIKAKALDETRKVEEVTFINTLNNEGRKADLQQRLEEGEARRAEALAAILAKQQGAATCVKEAAERRRQAEAERLAQLAERQRRKQEAQAKIEAERQATAAAKEAAKAAAHAVTQQREAARQQHAALLSNRINARLKEAAQRRVKHLEMIRERAALGKDLERRDGSSPASGSRSPSPALLLGKQHQQRQQLELQLSVAQPTAADTAAKQPAVPAARSSKLNAAAAAFVPASISSSRASSVVDAQHSHCAASLGSNGNSSSGSSSSQQQLSSSQISTYSSSVDEHPGTSTRGSSPVPFVPGVLIPQPAAILQQLKGHSQSVDQAGITPAGTHKSSIKGARRRMAKCRRKLLDPGTGLFSEPEHALQLTCSPEAQQLLATWASHLALLNVQPPQLRSMQQTAGQATTSQSTVAGQQQPQPCSESCVSSCSTPDRSARNSCTASGSNTPEQPGSARCRCSSNLQATFHWVAANERRDALVALINSAQAALQKQPLVVCHLSRQTGFLHLLCKEVLSTTASAAQYSCGDAAAAAGAVGQQHGAFAQVKARQDKVQEARMLELLVRLLELPTNLDYLLGSGPLLPGFAKAMLAALDHCNSLDSDEPAMMTGGEAVSRLSVLLQVLVAVLEHPADTAERIEMQEELVGFMVAAGTIDRLASVFSLFDQPMRDAAQAVPPHVLQCLRLLHGLTAVRCINSELLVGKRWPKVNSNAAAIIMDLQATAMAGVLSLLTAVLLNASPSCTPAEASSKALPPNFVEAAYLVMSVLNNVCCLDLLAAQHMLGCAHNRLEFFHLISFLLSYCSSRWPAAAPTLPARQPPGPPAQQQQPSQQQQQPAARNLQEQTAAAAVSVEYTGSSDCCSGSSSSSCGEGSSVSHSCSSSRRTAPEVSRMRTAISTLVHHPIAELLNQVLLLIGYFCVQHPNNQAILHWGRSPTILQRLCSMPFQYFVVPELKAVAMPTLLCVCHGADRACELISQHISMGMVLQFVQQEQLQQLGPSSSQPQQQQIPAEVSSLITRLTGPAENVLSQVSLCRGRVASNSDSGSGGSSTSASSTGSSSALPHFSLAKRFPLAVLQEAEQYLLQQMQKKSSTTGMSQSAGPSSEAATAEVSACS